MQAWSKPNTPRGGVVSREGLTPETCPGFKLPTFAIHAPAFKVVVTGFRRRKLWASPEESSVFRKLIVSLFIFTSLSAQASTAFACKMMGQVMMTHCCCHESDAVTPASASDGQSCCDAITLIGDHDGASGSAVLAKLPLPNFQPQPLLLVAAELVFPAATPVLQRWADPPAITQRSGSLTYLRTQRLRI